MFDKKNIIFALGLILIPFIPSLLLSKQIIIQNQNIPNDPYRKKISEINKDEVLWIDAREQKKYDIKHIPNAILMDPKKREEGLARLFEVFEPGQTIIVYCNQGCASSKNEAKRLRQELDQDNIYYLEGGMDVWFSDTP